MFFRLSIMNPASALPTVRATLLPLRNRFHRAPPAASIFSAAFPLNLCARTVSALSISPRPRTFTGRLRRARRARARAGAPASRPMPASNISPSVSRFTTCVLDAERVVEAALRHATVERHLAALEPALEPEARARLRALVCRAPPSCRGPIPGRGRSASSRAWRPWAASDSNSDAHGYCRHLDQMADLVNQPAGRGRVLELHRVPDPAQPQAASRQCPACPSNPIGLLTSVTFTVAPFVSVR